MLGYIKRLHSRGDTIVEVMIVLAVLGLAIGISYATANRSLLNARQAQENSQAANLVQSQVEAMRTLTDDPNQNIFQAGPYCISQNTPYTIQTGSNCDFGSIPYHIDITCANNPCSPTGDTFTIKATWDDIIDAGQKDSLPIVYRLYAPSTGSLAAGGGPGPSCTPPQVGTPPNCVTPTCPSGQTGTPPNCVTPTCPSGQTGTPPNCTKCLLFIFNICIL